MLSHLRKAGDIFKRDIDFYIDKPVGEGAFSTVYEGRSPDTVVKTFKDFETKQAPDYLDQVTEMAKQEAYLQQKAANVGLAPAVTGYGMSPYSTAPVIEMEDMRDMYRTVNEQYSGRPPREVSVGTQQQVGQLALQGLALIIFDIFRIDS